MKTGIPHFVAYPLSSLTFTGIVPTYSLDFITPNNQNTTIKMKRGDQIVVDCVTDNIPTNTITTSDAVVHPKIFSIEENTNGSISFTAKNVISFVKNFELIGNLELV
ncbi:MAG: hypothetical protein LBH02_03060 [Methanocalculaceae archaeon]|jgi:hypothetical protein|nr:hypothetical protein [Methanocalculaceae archaeon]